MENLRVLNLSTYEIKARYLGTVPVGIHQVIGFNSSLSISNFFLLYQLKLLKLEEKNAKFGEFS